MGGNTWGCSLISLPWFECPPPLLYAHTHRFFFNVHIEFGKLLCSQKILISLTLLMLFEFSKLYSNILNDRNYRELPWSMHSANSRKKSQLDFFCIKIETTEILRSNLACERLWYVAYIICGLGFCERETAILCGLGSGFWLKLWRIFRLRIIFCVFLSIFNVSLLISIFVCEWLDTKIFFR